MDFIYLCIEDFGTKNIQNSLRQLSAKVARFRNAIPVD
jgi:hypothetical protein